jgi:hypothetical protein
VCVRLEPDTTSKSKSIYQSLWIVDQKDGARGVQALELRALSIRPRQALSISPRLDRHCRWRDTMKYTILVYESDADFKAGRAEPHDGKYWGAYRAYTQALQQAGVMTGGAGLQPAQAATVVRQQNGARQVKGGPIADVKEQLGGYYVIEVPDLDTALDWASRCPAASTGAVEVRPHLAM